MADTKISALPSGSPALNTDLFPIARGGSNYSLTGQNISDLTVSNFTNGVLSWTPVITFGNASVGITYSSQSGTWTRVSNIVLLEAVMILTSKGSSTGTMRITGLPISFPTTNGEFAVGSIRSGFLTGLSGGLGISGSNGTSSLDVYQWSATGITGVADTNVTNTSTFFISLTCFA